MLKHIAQIILTGAVLLGCPHLSAQQELGKRVARRVPVTIMLVEETPVPGESFVIMRRPSVPPHDLILLSKDANAAHLSDAIRSLLTARAVEGDTAIRSSTMRMRPHSWPAESHARFPWTGRVLADLRTAPTKEISGVAKARAVEIWLPRQGSSGARR